jgi:hypothetical protein
MTPIDRSEEQEAGQRIVLEHDLRDTAQVDVDEARDGRGRAKRLPLLNEPFHLWRPRYRRLRNPKSQGFAPGKSSACPSHALTSSAIGGLKDGALGERRADAYRHGGGGRGPAPVTSECF